MTHHTKIILDESGLPRRWYNVIADLPAPPPPPLHPGTLQPVGPDDLAPLFPMDLIAQEVTGDRYVDIPEGVLDIYRLWRPTPLYRAWRLEQALGTPARIYYKYEGVSPAGSTSPTPRSPGLLQRTAGIRRLTTETGAGQWGSALAFSCAQFGLECKVWMVRVSYDQKPYRAALMQMWGATVHASPVPVTTAGAKSSRRTRTRRAASASPSVRPSRSPAQRRHPLRARQRTEPRADAPDGHRPGGDQADWRMSARRPT